MWGITWNCLAPIFASNFITSSENKFTDKSKSNWNRPENRNQFLKSNEMISWVREKLKKLPGCAKMYYHLCWPLNLGDYQCWGKVSFFQGLCLIAKEVKKGVTIILCIWLCFVQNLPICLFAYLTVLSIELEGNFEPLFKTTPIQGPILRHEYTIIFPIARATQIIFWYLPWSQACLVF